jgi:hypothetical protein
VKFEDPLNGANNESLFPPCQENIRHHIRALFPFARILPEKSARRKHPLGFRTKYVELAEEALYE